MAGLRLTFLGTGTSQGIPMIACDCPVCRSSDPRDRRTRSSVYLETPEAAWVIDTGPEFRLQCLRERVCRMDAVLYTHAHTDHVMGFDDLRRFCPDEKALPIYAGPDTIADLKRIFFFAFNGKNLYPGYIRPDPRVVTPFVPFSIGETTVTALPLVHGRSEVYGYLMERDGQRRVAYLCDCKEAGEETIERVKGVEVLIVDALRRREHPTHMSLDEALEVVRKVQPSTAWFTHLCHEIGHAEVEAELPPNVHVAYDGLRLEV